MAYSDNDLKVLTGFKIDETALQQGVKEAIGNVEKISEVRIPIKVNGKEGVQVLRQYMDELNNTISTSQNFMKGANSQFMAGNEKITSFAEATNKAKSSLDALNNKIKSIDASFNAQTKSGEMVVNNLKEYTKAMTAGNKTEKQFSYQGQVLTETTQEYYDSVNKATRYIKTFTDAQGNSVSVLDKTTKKVTTLGIGFSDMIGTMMKVAQFQVITKVLNSFTMALTSSVDVIKDFDDALTEFKKVSELSGEALDDYTEKLGELGSEVARTRSEMISSATEFRKSGFSDEDSAQLAKISEMYRNTADDAITSSESAGFIVSQMKAYNNETEEFAQHTIDAVNNVSDNLAVSSTDISNGLSKTASAMSALGNSFEESMAMVAGATEVLHGQATKVARGLRTIGNNFANQAKQGKDLELSVEGVTQSISLLDKQTGDLKSTYSIFNEISKYWDKMSNSEKQALAIQYAGKNQFEVFMATESQMTDVQKAYTLAVDDNNMATKENERYMESLSAKLQALKAQFEEFVLGDGSLSIVIKLFVDLGTAVLKFANSDLGKLELKFVAIGAVVLTLVDSFSKLKAMMNMSASIATIKTLFGLIETEGVGAIMALSTAEKASILLTGISAVVAGVYLLQKAFDYFNTSQEELIENANNLSSEWETATNKAEELKTKISSIDEQIESLKSKGYITLTEQSQIEMLEQERDLLQQQEEIQETLANMAKVKMQGAIDNALTSTSDYDVYNAGSIQGTENGNLFQQVNSEVESYQKATQALNDYTREYNELLQKKESGQKLSYNEQQTLSQLEGKIDEATEKQSKYSDAVSENSNTIMEMYQALTDAGIPLSKMSPELQDAISSLDSMSYAMSDNAERITDEKSLLDELSGALGEQVDSVDEFIDKAGISGEKAEEIKEAFDDGNYLQAYALACQNATEDLSGLADGEDELTESTEEAVSALEKQLSAITTLYDSYGTLQQAVADFNTNGYIDPSNLKELLSLGDEYINLLQMQDGQLSINEAGFKALANAQYDKAEADAYEEYTQKMTALAQAEAKGTLDELQTATNSYSTEPMNAQLQNLVQNLGLAVDGFNDLAIASAKVNIKTDKGKNLAKQYSSSLQTQLTFIEAGRKGIGKHTASIKSNTKATGSNTSSRKSNTGSTKSNTDAQKANTEALKKNVEALKKQKEAIEKEKEDMEKVISYIKDKVNDYIDELKDAKDAETDLIDDALGGLDDIKDALGDAFDEDKIDKLNKIMDESVKKLDELNAELQKLRSEGKNTTSVEKEIEALNKSLEIQKQIIQYKQNAENAQKEEERIENEINRLKEENDELEQQLEYKQLLDNLAKAQQTRLKVYKEGQGFVYTQDQSAISEAQKALDEWLRKKKLDDQIKQLEDQRDRQKKIYDQQVENLDNLKNDCDELYDQMKKDLEEYKNQVEKRWDDQINYYKNWLKSFENGINEYENQQNRLLALEKTGIDFEQQGWQTRLSNLSSFVESYKAKLAELEEATRRLNEAQQAYEQAQAQASASGASSGASSGGGGGGSSSGGGGYNPAPASTPTPSPKKVAPLKGRVYSYNSGLNYRFIEGNDRSPKVTTTAWQHGFKVQKVFANGSAYVLTKSGKLALVQASEWNSDKVRRNAGTKAYASGASSISDDQMALVGDSPTNNELVIGSKLNGQFMNLKKGSGVVNATSTNTLAGLLNQLPKLTGHSINATTNNNTSSNDTVFSIGNITIDGANITDVTSFKNALINIKSEAVQRAYQH